MRAPKTAGTSNNQDAEGVELTAPCASVGAKTSLSIILITRYSIMTDTLPVRREQKVTRNMGFPRGRRQLSRPQRVWRGYPGEWLMVKRSQTMMVSPESLMLKVAQTVRKYI